MHKHPGLVQEFKQSFGAAAVFYSEATAERCTVALMHQSPGGFAVRGRALWVR